MIFNTISKVTYNLHNYVIIWDGSPGIIKYLAGMCGPGIHVIPGHLFINTLRPRQNGRHFADDIFKRVFLNENIWVPIKISLKFVPKGPVNNIPALVQIMAWRRPGDKPLSEPMMVNLLTHICVNRPQWRRLTGIVIPIINLRRSDNRLRFIMGILIPISRCLLSE